MATSRGSRSESRITAVDRGPLTGSLPRLWLVVMVVAALVTGYLGLWQYRPPDPVTPGGLIDLLYHDLQLFVLEFDAIDGAPVPWPLQVARFVAPTATVLAAAFAIVGASWWLRRNTRRGYAIVVGDTAEARAVAQAKRAVSRKAVFEIDSGAMASLRRAGVRRASTVYACGDDREDVAVNVATALAAVSVRPGDGPRVYAHVSDPELAVGLRARRLMTRPGERVEFFSMDEVAARACIGRESFPTSGTLDVLVAGAGAFGRAIIVALAQRWRGQPDRLRVTLVDARAARAKDQLLDRWPVVAQTCEIVAVPADHLEDVLRSLGHPYRAYICYEDEHVALRSTLAAVPLWHGGEGSLVVRLSRLSRHAEAFTDGRLLEDLDRRLMVANVAALAAPDVVADRDIYWELAPRIHARYVAHETAKGTPPRSTPALRPWEELTRDLKASNYDQARNLPAKLRAMGATVAPRSAQNPPFELTDEDVELLSRLEHERWARDRRAHGWRHGAVRDDARKRHPDLVPWDELSAESQDRDRSAVRGLPAEYGDVLAEFGLQIVRLAPPSSPPARVPAQAVPGAG